MNGKRDNSVYDKKIDRRSSIEESKNDRRNNVEGKIISNSRNNSRGRVNNEK